MGGDVEAPLRGDLAADPTGDLLALLGGHPLALLGGDLVARLALHGSALLSVDEPAVFPRHLVADLPGNLGERASEKKSPTGSIVFYLVALLPGHGLADLPLYRRAVLPRHVPTRLLRGLVAVVPFHLRHSIPECNF